MTVFEVTSIGSYNNIVGIEASGKDSNLYNSDEAWRKESWTSLHRNLPFSSLMLLTLMLGCDSSYRIFFFPMTLLLSVFCFLSHEFLS